MNLDDFEERLQRQPFRRLPDEWKAEILNAADLADQKSEPPPRWGWRELFWPHPAAWAGLAAAWVVIAASNVVMQENGSNAASVTAMTRSEDSLMLLVEQRRLYRELLEPALDYFPLPPVPDRETPARSRPRSSTQAEVITT